MSKIQLTLSSLKQYTKQILTVIIAVWIIGGVVYEFIRLAVSPDMASMDGLYVYLAAPITAGLPSYIIPNLLLKKSELQTGRYYGSNNDTI